MTTTTTAAIDTAQQPSLLRLNPLIRRRIYRYVGIAPWHGRPCTFDLHGRTVPFQTPDTSSFHGLLLSCRDIYAEAAALLYSANRFSIYYTQPGSLEPLRALTAPSLASLTYIEIVLNQASCHGSTEYYGYCCLTGREEDRNCGRYWCKEDHGRSHDLPLPRGDKLAMTQAMLTEWHLTAARLSAHVTSKLELSLVCDLDPEHPQALNVAKNITAPLHRFPSLTNCHVRLCKTPDARLQEVAQDAVLEACGIAAAPYLKPPSTSVGTTLLTLPRELRLRILEYTDLITPCREVTWSRQDRGYVVFSTLEPGAGQFFNCFINHGVGDRSSIGCFCRRRHTAVSYTCNCWAPPTPLFLICRTLYHDAQLVFFSGNHFIVHDLYSCPPCWLPELPGVGEAQLERGPNPRYGYPNERFAASVFLREVVPVSALAHLRFLEFVFPPYLPSSWPQAGQPVMQDWWATVDWLRDKINAPALTLRLVMAEVSPATPDAYSATITPAEGDTIMQSYTDIVRPLKKLAEGPDGLGRFYADFAYPWQWTEESERRRRLLQFQWLEVKKKEIKDCAERQVMGDRYDSLYANNREEPWHSMWKDWFYYNPEY